MLLQLVYIFDALRNLEPMSKSAALIEDLQNSIFAMQGCLRTSDEQPGALGLGLIEDSFPGQVFPRAVVHEFISTSSEEAASTSAFLSVLLGRMMPEQQYSLWVSTQPRRSVFPPAIGAYGFAPDRLLFIDTARPKDTLWVLEEALKCPALTAVVGELTELSFSDSRRLQLAVERSRVTAFVHRFRPRSQNAVACATRWKIAPLASRSADGLPGPGFAHWQVQLLKARSGKTGSWQVQWSPRGLQYTGQELGAVPNTINLQTA